MKLEIKILNKKIDTNNLIEDLINVSKKINKSPTIEEYNKNGRYESSVFIRRFGSWNKALAKIGLAPNNKYWTEIELLDNLKEVWKSLCRQPVRRDMDNKDISIISSGAYLRFYGNWSKALEQFEKYINNKEIELNTVLFLMKN